MLSVLMCIPGRALRAHPRAVVAPAATMLLALLSSIAVAQTTGQTDVANKPLKPALLIEPNVVFAIDDSGSMDSDMLLDTDEGSMYWKPFQNPASGAGAWKADGTGPQDVFVHNTLGTTQYRKVFPQQLQAQGAGIEPAGDQLAAPVPPTPQFAWVRSHLYNRIYYNPARVYKPWPAAIIGNNVDATSFSNAPVTDTFTHPLFSGNRATLNLFTWQDASLNIHLSFPLKAGMKFPIGARPIETDPVTHQQYLGAEATNEGTATGNKRYGIPYYPATYWIRAICTPISSDCVEDPGNSAYRLKRIEIKSSTNSYIQEPSRTDCSSVLADGRRNCTFIEEAQNFANWWQYYRKRKLMLAAGMGTVMESLGGGFRLGTLYFNVPSNNPIEANNDANYLDRPTIEMLSTSGNGGQAVRRKIAGRFYNRSLRGLTPALTTLAAIQHQFDNNANLIEYSCQRNHLFLMTDGKYSDAHAVNDSTWNQTGTSPGNRGQYAQEWPYTTTYKRTLADLALYLYSAQLRSSSLAAGKVPTSAADPNPNLHFNFHGVTLGVQGEVWPKHMLDDGMPNSPANVTWPDPGPASGPQLQGRQRIDDIWHASINGRGRMLLATNADEVASAINQVLYEANGVPGAQSGVALTAVKLGNNDAAFLAGFNSSLWSGDVTRHAVNSTTGAIDTTKQWSAAAELDHEATLPANRKLFTTNAVFDAAGVGAQINPGGTAAETSRRVEYLRGDTSGEGYMLSQLRPRKSRFGAVVGSVTALNAARTAGFVASNDGFLHAIDLSNGKELWGYAPRAALAEMGRSTQVNWAFRTVHDGSPVIGYADGVEMLVGGLGTAGVGWYAIDLTDTTSPSLTAAQLATNKVKWELPGLNTDLQFQMGLSVGRPLIVKTDRYGTVVILTSGYNAPLNDGAGRLFVVKPDTGQVLLTLVAGNPTPNSGDAGLAKVSGYLEPDGTVRYLYGGDLKGNLWRFDLGTAASPTSGVTRLAVLKDVNGNLQEIAVAPALANYKGKRIVMVGTGKVTGIPDLKNEARRNSFYAILDKDDNLVERSSLVQQTINTAGGGRTVTTNAVDWNLKRGWFADLPLNERANIDPVIGFKAVTFLSNQSTTDFCSRKSYGYMMDILSGGAVKANPNDTNIVVGYSLGNKGVVGLNQLVTSDGAAHAIPRDDEGTPGDLPIEKPSGLVSRKAGWRRVVR